MAWKEFSQLSKADQQHENTRQKMIVCQSCLDRAVAIATQADVSTLCEVPTVTKIAGELVDWVYKKANEHQDVDTKPEPNTGLGNTPDTTLGSAPAGTVLGQLPEPTLQQKKVLDAIMDKGIVCDYDTFRKQVLNWAEETHGQRSYPTKLESVETFFKWFNK